MGVPIQSKDLSGGLSFNTPNFTGIASNITADPETGIGSWSDGDIKRAIMEGVGPASARLPGVPLSDVMPFHFYKALVPSDADAIVAYLRTVPAVHNAAAGPNYKGPAGTDLYPDAEAGFTEASLSDPARRGAYLATLGHCMGCHSSTDTGRIRLQEWFREGGPGLHAGGYDGLSGQLAGRGGDKHHIPPARRNRRVDGWRDQESVDRRRLARRPPPEKLRWSITPPISVS